MTGKSNENNLIDTKLTKLLMKLTASEIREFKAWFKQMGSAKRDAFLVLEHLLKYYPDFPSKRLEQTVVYKKIFPNQTFNYRRLMKAVSQTYVALKKFLVMELLAEDDFLSDYLLAKIFTQRDLPNEQQLIFEKKIKKSPQLPEEFYEQMKWNELGYFSEDKKKKDNQTGRIVEANKMLDIFYLGQKLKYACEIVIKNKLFQQDHSIEFKAFLKAYCQQHYDVLPLFHQAYSVALDLIEEGNLPSFLKLKEILKQQSAKLPKEDQLYLLTHLINYIAQQIRMDEKKLLEECFDLYVFGIEKEIIIINEKLIDTHFLNIISVGCALKKFDWIEQNIIEKLSKNNKNKSLTFYKLGLARLHFGKKEFLECQTYLMQIDHLVFTHSVLARILQITCAYELKEGITYIDMLCDAFERYIKRNNKKQKPLSLSGLNFIHILRQLNKLNPKKQKLEKELSIHKPITYQGWLQEKIDEIK